MGRRIALVLILAFLAWLFVVRPATRGVALADVYNRVNEDRCCTDGLLRSPTACARALDELARRAPADQLARCAALAEWQSRDPAVRLCGFLAGAEDREAAARELALGSRLVQAAARPGCNRLGKIAAVREALKGGCDAALPLADALPANDAQRAAILKRCNRPADPWPRPAAIVVPGYAAQRPRTDVDSALAECEHRITECAYTPLRSLDACAISMPACRTGEFWTEAEVCCPQRCMDAYAAARSAGRNEMSALIEVYREGAACAQGQ